ncbi:MAG: ThuA domain-containing protein [Bacteroidia bacterium]|nr:ThuA domain-containing protein [Bacteroidia bacterium]
MKTRLLLTFLIILLFVSFNTSASKLKIIIVTGGHDFDRESFFQMFDSFKSLSYIELVHPDARVLLGTIDLASFDAVVFYDMPKTITDEEKDSYYRLLKAGKGLLFLHHSICAYQDWPEFENIIGGKYYEKKKNDKFGASSYQHDVGFNVHLVHNSHPVTRGMKDFVLHDEVYGNLEILPEIYPLLSTDHPKSNLLIGWTLKKGDSKIVFIQPGHDKYSFTNPAYRRLIEQAISYITAD